MTEETEGQEIGAEAIAGGVDPAAVALALGGASREDAGAFLKKQSALIDDQRKLVQLQAKELSHELGLRHWSLWVRHASGLLKLALEFSAGLLLLFAVSAIGVMVWNAAHADGLVIESFSVPSDLASRGLSGQVVATQMLDKLTAMQSATRSNRAPRTYANNWGDDIKVEIPDTGISIGEAYRFLRGWLGHETHISGEVYRSATGIALTARIGADSGASFAGAENDLDALVQKAAEHLYGITQPYRYGVYLEQQGRHSEAATVFQALAKTGPPSERAWAYIGLAVGANDPDPYAGSRLFGRAVELDPTNALAIGDLANTEGGLGHAEQAVAGHRKALALLSSMSQGQIREDFIAIYRQIEQSGVDRWIGDFRSAALESGYVAQSGQSTGAGASAVLARSQADAHETAAARATLADPLPETPGFIELGAIANGQVRIEIAVMTQDWTGVLRQADLLQPLLLKHPRNLSAYHLNSELNVAIAEAELGRVAEAEARVADTPGDCYQCLRARARIAAVKGEPARADWWFDRAARSDPSIPLAYAEWGQALLERGDPDGAIAKFTLANQKGPHFADPLEMWGEALMKKNRSDLALAKFAEADKYAPNWGRLHLKWGEALIYTGKKDEAQKQFAQAAGLDLSSADKAELAKEKTLQEHKK
jgi:tetratricopeptide (TPR) repeat protein